MESIFINMDNIVHCAHLTSQTPITRFGVIKTQRPTHPPLERNSEDHIEECCDPKCYISKQTHHDDLMSKLSCIVKLQLLATTAMPNCHVSASVQEHSSFLNSGAMRLDTPFNPHGPVVKLLVSFPNKVLQLLTRHNIQAEEGEMHPLTDNHSRSPLSAHGQTKRTNCNPPPFSSGVPSVSSQHDLHSCRG